MSDAPETLLLNCNSRMAFRSPRAACHQAAAAEPRSDRCISRAKLCGTLCRWDRYMQYGLLSARAAEEMRRPDVLDHFTRLVQRTSPKSYAQAQAEVAVTRRFLENFSGDQVCGGGAPRRTPAPPFLAYACPDNQVSGKIMM